MYVSAYQGETEMADKKRIYKVRVFTEAVEWYYVDAVDEADALARCLDDGEFERYEALDSDPERAELCE